MLDLSFLVSIPGVIDARFRFYIGPVLRVQRIALARPLGSVEWSLAFVARNQVFGEK
jgi:hypothetical protein